MEELRWVMTVFFMVSIVLYLGENLVKGLQAHDGPDDIPIKGETSVKKKKVAIKKFVHIDPSRGYGNGLYGVVGEVGRGLDEYELVNMECEDEETFRIYKAHCYEKLSSKFAFRDYKRDLEAQRER